MEEDQFPLVNKLIPDQPKSEEYEYASLIFELIEISLLQEYSKIIQDLPEDDHRKKKLLQTVAYNDMITKEGWSMYERLVIDHKEHRRFRRLKPIEPTKTIFTKIKSYYIRNLKH
jgi:hypothetical protein